MFEVSWCRLERGKQRHLGGCAQQIERRIATATPPNRLTTQRRLLHWAGAMRMGAAMMRFTLRFLDVVPNVGPAEKAGRATLDLRGAKNLHQGRN